MIKVKNLHKYFGKKKAVNGVSFEVQLGEIFGFLGPNGAGKTTTIRCIMGLTSPLNGEIEIDGMKPGLMTADINLDLGYLPSDAKVYSNLTGKEHLDFIESIRGKSKTLKQLIKDFDFDVKVQAGSLSTGNRQKLLLIMALMYQPKILVLDEPTAGLDPLVQNTLYQKLYDLKAKGTTIFLSSHNLSEVEKICDRVGIIREGEMVAVESIENLKGKKRHSAIIKLKEEKKDWPDFIEIVNAEYSTYRVRVQAEMDIFVKYLAGLDIVDLEITPASLEELFLSYYN